MNGVLLASAIFGWTCSAILFALLVYSMREWEAASEGWALAQHHWREALRREERIIQIVGAEGDIDLRGKVAEIVVLEPR